MKKTGLFGGSFNPIHLGHLIIAQHFVTELNLDKCIFIPSAVSPFKQKDSNILELEHRLELLNLAINDNPDFEVSDFELKKGGVSYTIETIEHFRGKEPETEFHWLAGGDQAQSFHKWKNYRDILKKITLVIAARPNTYTLEDKAVINSKLTIDSKPVWLSSPLIDISSSDIRQKIKKDIPVKYLITRECEDYIIKNGLYK